MQVLGRISGIAVHLICLLILPPMLAGLIGWGKARIAGRRGPGLLQPYRDLLRLARKGAVYGQGTSVVFRLGPPMVVASGLLAGLFVPLAGIGAPLHFSGDLVVFAALLALGRAALVLAALDTGSAFEGLGASRAASFGALAEPTMFLILVALGLLGQSSSQGLRHEWSLTTMLMQIGPVNWLFHAPALIPISLALFTIILLENARIPFDDPTTHLELTMVHEVMALDHSGPDLALIEYAGMQKLFVMGALLVGLFDLHRPGAWLAVRMLTFLAGLALLAALIVLTEVSVARVRLRQVPRFLLGAFLLAALGVGVILYEFPRF